jgi:hypothetical protein
VDGSQACSCDVVVSANEVGESEPEEMVRRDRPKPTRGVRLALAQGPYESQ